MATNRYRPPSADDVLRKLPKTVVRRVKALKELLKAQYHVEQNFNTELHLLERKYHKYYTDIYNKRSDIVSGNYEPTEEECDYTSDDENYDDKNASVDMAEVVKLTQSKPATPNVSDGSDLIKGIPNFWSTVIQNTLPISDLIQPCDEPILSYLTDIKIHLSKEPGFTLAFCFSPNKWFTNAVLTKEYKLKHVLAENSTLDLDTPTLCQCRGCIIQWKEGMNVTVKLVKDVEDLVIKVQDELIFEVVEKTIPSNSFFHFFSPSVALNDVKRATEQEIARLLADDYEVGNYIRERVVPRAVLYYTGEALIDIIEADQRENAHDLDDDDDDDDNNEKYAAEVEAGIRAAPSDEEVLNRSDFAGECKHH